MISAWWLIPVFFIGIGFGVFLLGLCSAGTRSEEERSDKVDEHG